ncbi:MAG: Gmad2 immunoglobulin-like domain-containing protein [Patescibacteria group bacterium]|jgi:hypothetical protein
MLKKMLIGVAMFATLGPGCVSTQVTVSQEKFLACQQAGGSTVQVYPRRCQTEHNVQYEEEAVSNYGDKISFIRLNAPWPTVPVNGSVTVTGEARTWYFEASFPVTVETPSGTVLGTGIAQAQGDWMTDAFVPFEVTVNFTPQPAFTQGFMVFHKDNPSGLPEHDDYMKVPITFGN